jgi:ATP/maltotriose-dependent transcriptional regulator MalT
VSTHVTVRNPDRDPEPAWFVSSKTVRNTVSSIYAKLHAAGRAEAIIQAREAGLGRDR